MTQENIEKLLKESEEHKIGVRVEGTAVYVRVPHGLSAIRAMPEYTYVQSLAEWRSLRFRIKKYREAQR